MAEVNASLYNIAPVSVIGWMFKISNGISVPYASVLEANKIIPGKVRYDGMFAVISEVSGGVLYWYHGGVGDLNLVKFDPKVDAANVIGLADFITLNNASYKGSAYPTTNPGTPTASVYYLATDAGTYTNFKDNTNTPFVVGANDTLVFFTYNPTGNYWTKQSIDLVSSVITKVDGHIVLNASNCSVNINTTTNSIEVTAVANNAFVVQGKTYYNLVTGTNALITDSGQTNGLNFIAYRKSTQQLYVYNYTYVDSITSDHILVGYFFSWSTVTRSIVTDSPISIDGQFYSKRVVNSLMFLDRIRIDRTNNKVIIPSFWYLQKYAAAVKKVATDYGSVDAFTFDLQLNNIGDTLIFDPDRLNAGTNPFYIESPITINTVKPSAIIVLHMILGKVTSFFNLKDDADLVGTGTIAGITDYYKNVIVSTYANALTQATGSQKKIITVTADETDGGNKNRYFYEGVDGDLDIIF